MKSKKDITIFIVGFILLQIANISSTYAQEYPILTEIDGIKVVIWSLDQDKDNSILIERFYECDSLHQSLEKDIRRMEDIKREDENQYNLLFEAFQACEEQGALRDQAFQSCSDQRENDQQIIKAQKKKILKERVVGGITIFLLVILLL